MGVANQPKGSVKYAAWGMRQVAARAAKHTATGPQYPWQRAPKRMPNPKPEPEPEPKLDEYP